MSCRPCKAERIAKRWQEKLDYDRVAYERSKAEWDDRSRRLSGDVGRRYRAACDKVWHAVWVAQSSQRDVHPPHFVGCPGLSTENYKRLGSRPYDPRWEPA